MQQSEVKNNHCQSTEITRKTKEKIHKSITAMENNR